MASNKPGIIARLFKRSPSGVVGKLYSVAIGQPLLVEPARGEALLQAYLAGAVDTQQPLIESRALSLESGSGTGEERGAPSQVIRIFNISGALVNRPMPDICGEGPASYEAIGEAFDAAMADESVTAVIFRMASPGGMAAGCFDLSDRIMAARGTKPIYGIADDYAYSACYALLAACDEIWVTRTAGVGSVGVVCWHVDQSGYNAKTGLTVTPIYSGERKVDFSPHQPLSDEARAGAQMEIDRLRSMFVDSVARYRGMSADAIRATEAQTYSGEAAVAAGLADRVGTMRDLLTHVRTDKPADAAPDDPSAKTSSDEPATAAQTERPEALTAEQTAALGRAALADALAASSLAPDLVKALLGADVPADQITARIEHAGKIADLCVAGRLPDLAAGFVARHADLEVVRAELMAAAESRSGPELITTFPAQKSGTAASGHWGETIKRFGGN